MVHDVTHFSLLGTGLDSSPGEVLDKAARKMQLRRLGLTQLTSVGGGRAIELLASLRHGDPFAFDFPVTRSQDRDCDLSFSGLHSTVNKFVDQISSSGSIGRCCFQPSHSNSSQRSDSPSRPSSSGSSSCLMLRQWCHDCMDKLGQMDPRDRVGYVHQSLFTFLHQLMVIDYANRLCHAVEEDSTSEQLRSLYLHRYNDLCYVHLSFVLDIAWNIPSREFHDTNGRMALRKLLPGFVHHHMKGYIKLDDASEAINAIIDRLDTDQACMTEGIFRKTGNCIRKRQLQEAILDTKNGLFTIDWDLYSVHDIAGVLKSIISSLSAPIFHDRLMPYFIKVASPRPGNSDVEAVTPINNNFIALRSRPAGPGSTQSASYLSLIRGKELKAYRLLIQLLPRSHKELFKRLIKLLGHVTRLKRFNRMEAESLGTIFGPVIFPQSIATGQSGSIKTSKLPSEQRDRCKLFCSIVSSMIQMGMDLFLVPITLMDDIKANLNSLSHPTVSVSKESPVKQSSSSHKLTDRYRSIRAGHVCFNTPQQTNIERIQQHPTTCCSPKPMPHSPTFDSPPLQTFIRFATPITSSSVGSSATTPITLSPVLIMSRDGERSKSMLIDRQCSRKRLLANIRQHFASASYKSSSSSSSFLRLGSKLKLTTPTTNPGEVNSNDSNVYNTCPPSQLPKPVVFTSSSSKARQEAAISNDKNVEFKRSSSVDQLLTSSNFFFRKRRRHTELKLKTHTKTNTATTTTSSTSSGNKFSPFSACSPFCVPPPPPSSLTVTSNNGHQSRSTSCTDSTVQTNLNTQQTL